MSERYFYPAGLYTLDLALLRLVGIDSFALVLDVSSPVALTLLLLLPSGTAHMRATPASHPLAWCMFFTDVQLTPPKPCSQSHSLSLFDLEVINATMVVATLCYSARSVAFNFLSQACCGHVYLLRNNGSQCGIRVSDFEAVDASQLTAIS